MKKTILLLIALLAALPASARAEGLPGFEDVLEAAREAVRAQSFIGPVLPEAGPDTLPLGEALATPDEPSAPLAADASDASDVSGVSDAPDSPDAPDLPDTPDASDIPASTTPADSSASADLDLSLALSPESPRVEEGASVALVLTATNPLSEDVPVELTLKLPERLSCAGDVVWQAVLPAAGASGPSVTEFTREATLLPGGEAGVAVLEAELSMGARFYRASAELELCVPDVAVAARVEGTDDGRIQPGAALTYLLTVRNAGNAACDVPIDLELPDGVSLAGDLPEGFKATGRRISGIVRAEAAAQVFGNESPSEARVELSACVDEDALVGDDDACRLLSGALRADGERVPLPRVQVCAPRVSARLVPERDSLEVGAEMELRIALVNAGLVPADVRVTCALPEGLVLVDGEEEKATPAEPDAALPPDDGATPQAAAMLTEEAELPAFEPTLENGTLVYDVRMDAAEETADGVAAATRVLTVRVRAEREQEALREKLVGASLAYTTGDDTRLAEAVAVRVYTPAFMGITREEWGGIFWAAVLLIVTVACLYAAVRTDDDVEDYVFD